MGGDAGVLLCLIASLASRGACDLVDQFAADQHGAGLVALSLARRAFDTYTLQRERIPTPEGLPELLRKRSGVFVSAVRGGAPRCCMGSLYPTQANLADDIIAAAVAAAGLDARRAPVEPDELHELQLIVSIVAPPESITDPRGIDPVKEGIAARGAQRTGVVLPGETPHLDLAIQWARIRAGIGPTDRVDYFRLRAFRIAEPRHTHQQASGRD